MVSQNKTNQILSPKPNKTFQQKREKVGKIGFTDNDKSSPQEGADNNLEWEAEFGLMMKFLNQSS